MYRFIRSVCELPLLIGMNLMLSFSSLWEYLKVVRRYYGNVSFRRADWALLRAYRWSNPYKIHKHFLQQRGELEVYRYGETWLTTMELLAKEAEVTRDDIYVELGCGRGRSCFWMHSCVGCQVVGIDYVPIFIERATAVVQKLKLKGIRFLCHDFLTEAWVHGTVFYIDATLLEGEEMAQLVRRCDQLPRGCRVIGVNLSLTTGDPHDVSSWVEEKRLMAPYPWGSSEVGIFRKGA